MKMRRCDGCGQTFEIRLTTDWSELRIPILDLELDVCSSPCLWRVSDKLMPESNVPTIGREKWNLTAIRKHRVALELDPAGEA